MSLHGCVTVQPPTQLLLLEKSSIADEAAVEAILPPIPPPIAFHASLSDLPLFAVAEAT